MKWIVRKGHIPTTEPDEIKFFEEIDPKNKDGDPGLEDELKKLGFELWVQYPETEYSDPLPKIKEQTQRKYEIFCGGLLYYHDVEFKKYSKGKGYTDENGYPEWKVYPEKYIGHDGKEYLSKDFEHKIYFEWYKEKGRDIVRIFINSTPDVLNTNPPPPPKPPPPES